MKSYTFGLLQTNAFKGLKGYTSLLLEPHQLTTYQWALLGVLFDEENGLGTTRLAEELKVSKPFITKTIQNLIETDWVEKSTVKESDLRNARFILNASARAKVPVIEHELKAGMKEVLSGISKLHLLAYVLVLKHISKKLESAADLSVYEVQIKK